MTYISVILHLPYTDGSQYYRNISVIKIQCFGQIPIMCSGFGDRNQCGNESSYFCCVELLPDGKKSSFGTDVSQIGSVESVRQLDDGFVVNFAVFGDRAGVNLQNFQTGRFVR